MSSSASCGPNSKRLCQLDGLRKKKTQNSTTIGTKPRCSPTSGCLSTCRSMLDLFRSRGLPLCSLVEMHRCQSLHSHSEIALKSWSPCSPCVKTAVGGFLHRRRRWILPHWSAFLPVLRHVPLRPERSRCEGWLVCRVMKSCSSLNQSVQRDEVVQFFESETD